MSDPQWDSAIADVHACIKLFREGGRGIKRNRKEGGSTRAAKKVKA